MTEKLLNLDEKLGSLEVIKHLDLLQSVITRMAANSSACKGWAIGLVSAVLAFLASNKSAGTNGWIATIPLLLFFLLDAYYLSLEKHFRDVYNDFVGRLHDEKAVQRELFVLTPPAQGETTKMVWKAIKSISVWPFYILLALMIGGVSVLVLGASSCGDFRHPLCPRSEGRPAPAAEVSGRDAPTPGRDRQPGTLMSPAPLKPPTPSPATP